MSAYPRFSVREKKKARAVVKSLMHSRMYGGRGSRNDRIDQGYRTGEAGDVYLGAAISWLMDRRNGRNVAYSRRVSRWARRDARRRGIGCKDG